MKYLVTGGAGFIGSHLSKYLLERGHSVCVLDNLSTGSMDRLKDTMDSIEFIMGDIKNRDDLKIAMRACDGVFHQAALVAVQESYLMQQEYHDVNVTGTKNILEIAREYGIRVVYASSSSVYGTPQSVPIREDAPHAPENPYGKTKSDCEVISQTHMGDDGAGVMGLRYFNVYGRGQTGAYAGVITQFMRRLKSGLGPIINGDGLQTRDFVNVMDVAEANLGAMTSTRHDGFFNIGTGNSVTINKLADIMTRVYELDVSAEYSEPLQGDVPHSMADTQIAARDIPWQHSINLEDGLSKLIHGSIE